MLTVVQHPIAEDNWLLLDDDGRFFGIAFQTLEDAALWCAVANLLAENPTQLPNYNRIIWDAARPVRVAPGVTPDIEPNTSISHGTMRPEDLIPRFIDAIPDGAARTQYEERWRELQAHDPAQGAAREQQDYLLEDLFDALNDYAPLGCYFGAHPGDGSDYGFWEVEPDE